MQRRGFLGAILAAGMAPAFVGAKVLMPVRALALAEPVQLDVLYGWAPLATGRNSLLTVSMITNEALKILESQLSFMSNVNREWEAGVGKTIAIRRPQRLVA